MPFNNDHIAALIIKHLQETITAEETQTLEQWIAASDDNRAKFNRFTNGETLSEDLMAHSLSDQQIQELVYGELPEVKDALTVIVTPKRNWMRWMSVAAAVLVIAFASVWLLKSKETTTTNGPEQQVPVATDIPPGGNKATLTLADGTNVVLDRFSNNRLVQQGSTDVFTKDGKLVYQAKGKQKEEVIYNTLTTSKSETFGTILSDGSKIWLNSESSIRYPVTFSGSTRHVEVTGEAYFEIMPMSAEDRQRKLPFIVSVKGMDVEVLGTHFNINCYDDEDEMKTTVLEGRVKVSQSVAATFTKELTNGKKPFLILKPGEQSSLNKQTQHLTKFDNSDLEKAIAWKNGQFKFYKDDLKTVMKQLARWYNLDIVYQGNIPKGQFVGTVPRNMNLSQVLAILASSDVHFEIKGKVLIVKP